MHPGLDIVTVLVIWLFVATATRTGGENEIGPERSFQSREDLAQAAPALRFEALLTAVDSPLGSQDDSDIYALIEVDSDCAWRELSQAERLKSGHPAVVHILSVANYEKQPLPWESLRALIEDEKNWAHEYPQEWILTGAIEAASRNPGPGADDLIRSGLKSPSELVRTAAAEGLGRLVGIESAFEYVLQVEEEHGFAALSEAQKTYMTAWLYDMEVRNGGHSQYYSNSSGDHARLALRSCELIGAKKAVRTLRASMAVFGASGPSPRRSRRDIQVGDLSEAQEEQLSALDDQFYASEEYVAYLLALYVLEHPGDFKD